jgi:cell division septal protein FtsQ
LKRLKRPKDSKSPVEMPDLRRFVRPALWILAIALVVLAGTAFSLAYFTGACRIRQVNFSGNKYLTTEYLRQLSGIDSYKNLVTLPVGRIAKSLESNPWVEDARIQRHLLHTVNIGVVERKPVAVLDCAGTEFLVEGDGYVIARNEAGKFPELPRVHGGDAPPPATGSVIADRKTLDCVRVIASMPQPLRDILALGNPFDGRGQVFITRLGFNIIYGSATRMSLKNEVLEAITIDVKNNKRKIAYIDVRVPDSPVVKPT